MKRVSDNFPFVKQIYELITSDDHIHHLIHLLDEPEQAQEGEAQGDAEPAESSTYGTATPSEAGQPDEVVPEDVTPASLTRSGPDMPNGYSDEKSTPTGMAINFLQEDELESGIEDSYEVIPMPEPQEVCSQKVISGIDGSNSDSASC